MAENVLNLKKETDIQKQEAQRVSSKMAQNRPMSSYIIIKMTTVKENSKGSKSKTKSHIHALHSYNSFMWQVPFSALTVDEMCSSGRFGNSPKVTRLSSGQPKI